MTNHANSATKTAPIFNASVPNTSAETQSRPLTWRERLARKAVLGRMKEFDHGHLLVEENGVVHALGRGGPEAYVHIHDPATWTSVAAGGTVGAGTSYIAGHWSCKDLTALIQIFLRNRAALDNMEQGLARFGQAIFKLLHRFNRNTPLGSRRNIAAHYDLGNDFYRLWLDETMMYSSALFTEPQMSLHAAQIAKLDRLCELLDVQENDHVLEIGSGWGGLALHLVQRRKCKVTTTTISEQQYLEVKKRVQEAGLQDHIRVLKQDYRDLTGSYDKIVSVEMIEAVGHHYYDTYFATISRLLKPDGLAVIQAITIAEQQYHTAIREVDFIQRYIFPGSNIPSLGAITKAISRSSDLNLISMEDLAPHYVRTLQCWRSAFHKRLNEIRALGYDNQFIRMWEFYLTYCEGGFSERAIGVAHLRFARGQWRHSYQNHLDNNPC
jgi:cyclopropane-fatty-acyl-phospholipid synthase